MSFFDIKSNRLAFLNLEMKIKRRQSRYLSGPRNDLFTIHDDVQSLVFCRQVRAYLYKRGIAKRLSILAASYHLNKMPEGVAGAFIDCGANVGELGVVARGRGWDYHAFEPESLEADCCDINVFNGEAKTNRVALWSEETILTFYSKPDTADSSVFEQDSSVRKIEMKTTTIDKYVEKMGITDIAVLKIEAEGAEPEVLQGAEEALKKTRFITVDCGFERGMRQESTLAPVVNFLLQRGFRLIDWDRKWCRFLFEKA